MTQCKYAGALCIGCEKCVGVDAHKQIRLHLASFLNTNMQWHKIVGIAREVGPHRAALDGGGIDAIAQLHGNLQHHILFFGAIGANSTRVFAAMAGVNGNHNQAICDGRWSRCSAAGCWDLSKDRCLRAW